MDNNKDNSRNKEEVKEKTSEIIERFSKMLKKTAHSLIDTGEKAKEHLEQTFKKAQEELEGVMDYISSDVIPQEELKDGDLVISSIDVKFQADNALRELYPDGVIHKKGEVFEYNEERDEPFVKSLFKPTLKQAANYGGIRELSAIVDRATGQAPELYQDIKIRIERLKNEK